MTEAQELEAFEAAIRADPFSDTPKLAFADWLEERERQIPCRSCAGFGEAIVATSEVSFLGGGWSSKKCDPCDGAGQVSNHFEARAKFIRGQVLHEPDMDGSMHGYWELHERPKMARDGLAGHFGHFGYAGMTGGFPSAPLTTYSQWFGASSLCPNCQSMRGQPGFIPHDCNLCEGVGMVDFPAVGPKMLERYPIQTVHFTDKQPVHTSDGWMWTAREGRNHIANTWRIEFPPETCRIDAALMQITGTTGKGSQVPGRWPGGLWDRIAFKTGAEATEMLAIASIVWACEMIHEAGGPDTPEFRWKLTGKGWRRNRGAYREWRTAELKDAARDRDYQRHWRETERQRAAWLAGGRHG